MSSLVIIIDPWSIDSGTGYDQCMKNIRTFCEQDVSVTAIALSAYAKDIKKTSMYHPEWAASSEFWFDKDTKWKSLRRQWQNIKWEKPNIHSEIERLKPKVYQDKFIACSDLHIMYYCNAVNVNIDSIYFFGFSWAGCVRDRPTGWLQTAFLQHHGLMSRDIKLRTKLGCVYDGSRRGLDVIMDPGWSATTDDQIYELDIDGLPT
jgi:hypothetical protein